MWNSVGMQMQIFHIKYLYKYAASLHFDEMKLKNVENESKKYERKKRGQYVGILSSWNDKKHIEFAVILEKKVKISRNIQRWNMMKVLCEFYCWYVKESELNLTMSHKKWCLLMFYYKIM